MPDDINNWEGYFWIDVQGFPEDIDGTRKLKEESVEKLLNLFESWREHDTTFEQDQLYELYDAARTYFQIYTKMLERLASGDVNALLDSPIDAKVVEDILHFDMDLDFQERLRRVTIF